MPAGNKKTTTKIEKLSAKSTIKKNMNNRTGNTKVPHPPRREANWFFRVRNLYNDEIYFQSPLKKRPCLTCGKITQRVHPFCYTCMVHHFRVVITPSTLGK